jgi:putative transposase
MEVSDGAEAVFAGADCGQVAGGGAVAGAGMTVAQVCRRIGVSDQTFFRWRVRYGALKDDEAQRLRQLELENSRLKRIVAEKELEIQILKELERGKW